MLNILYAGSPSASAKMLEKLVESSEKNGFRITGVLTNPPSVQGRHNTVVPTAVAQTAEKFSIPVFAPEHLDSTLRDQVSAVAPDIFVCFAYGHIFGPKFLSLFKYGGMNLHPSALPKYRGCTPVQTALLNGDKSIMITVQTVVYEMDEGAILAQEELVLGDFSNQLKKDSKNFISTYNDSDVNTGAVLDYSAECGARMISKILSEISSTGVKPTGRAQKGEASYTEMITKADAKIDWTQSAEKIVNKIHACCPDPCAWTTENGQPLKLLKAHDATEYLAQTAQMDTAFQTVFDEKPGTVIRCDKNCGILITAGNKTVVAVTFLQRQGKNALDSTSFMNGARCFSGTVLE